MRHAVSEKCKIERRKSGVCGAGLSLNIYGRHVWLRDTYEYERARVWLRLNSHSGQRQGRDGLHTSKAHTAVYYSKLLHI